MHESLSQQFRIFLIAGNDEGIVFLLGGGSAFYLFCLSEHGTLVALILLSILASSLPVLVFLGLVEESAGFVGGTQVPGDGLHSLECEEGEDA